MDSLAESVIGKGRIIMNSEFCIAVHGLVFLKLKKQCLSLEHESFRKYHLVTIRRNLRRRRIFHRQYRIIYHNHRYSLRAPDSQTRYIGIMALRKRDRT